MYHLSNTNPIFMPFLEQHDITNPEITPSYADAEKFLDLIAGDPGKCFMFRVVAERADLQAELAPLQKKENEKAKLENRKPHDLLAASKPGTLAELWGWLVACNAQGWAVYVVINETTGNSDKDVVRIRANFADFDEILEDAEQCNERTKRLRRFNELAPTSMAVSSSPDKFHSYWLTQGIPLENFKPVQRRIVEFFGSDPMIINLSRVMRVPGFLHQKNEPYLTRITWTGNSEPIEAPVLETALGQCLKELGPWPYAPPKTKPGAKIIPLHAKASGEGLREAEAERIRSALSVIPTDDRDIWLKIGAALHSTGWGEGARQIWDEWSRSSGKFDEPDQEKTWRSFDRGYDGQTVGLGTLFHLAKEYGWSDRPARAKSNGLPVIQIKAGNIEQIVDEAERALIASNRGLYQRAGQIVCVGESRVKTKNSGEIMRQTIRERRDHALVEDMTAAAKWERFDARRKSWVEVDAPMGIAKTLQQRHSRLQLPVLSGVINAPTLRADGSLLVKPGYDQETGLLFDPQGVAFSPIPNNPTREEAKAALGSIKGLIGTFHFVGKADCAVALSAILTAVVRKSAIRQSPMHCFDAPLPGSGKGKLVDITSIIATGKEAGIVAQGRTEEELEKRLGALLFAGDQIAIDNCCLPLGGAFLCALLTQSTVMVRILGKSEIVEVPTDVLATATGNNLRIDGDMTRRVLICRIDPETERPELRKFANDPVADAKVGRPRLVGAALLVLRAYIAAGKPPQAHPLGSYEDWSDLVRSTLMWLGEADPVETMERARETDPRLDEKGAVMAAWAAVIGQRKVTARKVSEWASGEGLASPSGQNLRDALLAIAGVGDEIDTKRLGNWLRANKGARLEGSAFEEAGKANGQVVWRLHQFDKANEKANCPVRSPPSSTEEEEEIWQKANGKIANWRRSATS